MKQSILKNIFPLLLASFIAVVSLFGTGCKKEKLLSSGGQIRFSVDTLSFDTVFTTQGSFTLGIRIFNPQDQKIVLSTVKLEKGAASFFHLNVDGFPGNAVNNIEIAANDSIYVFATVKIDPNSDNSPFFIEDKLIVTLNGNDFSIPVIAYGQNAYYVNRYVFTKDTTWAIDKPYVVANSAWVAENTKLTIPKGCRVYMHQNSRLIIDGTLEVNGAPHDSVVFQGDRLDRAYFGYEGYPGEWGGIYFSSRSKNNKLNYAVLKNGGNTAEGAAAALIQVNPDSFRVTGVPQLTMNQVILQNSIGYGLLAFNGSVTANNCLIHTCGAQALALVMGGVYNFNNSTVVNYGSNKVSHVDNSAAILLNYYKVGDNKFLYSDMDATMNNCIFYGSLQNELVIDSLDLAGCIVRVNHCAVKADLKTIPGWVQQDAGMIYNTDPAFEKTETEKWNFRLKAGSPCIDKGMPIPSLTVDLDGNPRTVGLTDIGAYERQ